jgi:hypothetical protein
LHLPQKLVDEPFAVATSWRMGFAQVQVGSAFTLSIVGLAPDGAAYEWQVTARPSKSWGQDGSAWCLRTAAITASIEAMTTCGWPAGAGFWM